MDWSLLLQVTIPLFGAGAWLWSRIDKRFERIENRLQSLESSTNKGFNDLNGRLSKLEGRVDLLASWVERVMFDKTGTP